MAITGVEIGIIAFDGDEELLFQRDYSITGEYSQIERVRLVCDCIYKTDADFAQKGYVAYTIIPVIRTTSGERLMTYEGRGRLAH